MSVKYFLQQYEDGTFGYLHNDGDEENNVSTGSKVVCTQGKDEDREEFIAKNGITFRQNQYGSNLNLDLQILYGDWSVRIAVAKQGYGLDKLVNDYHWLVRKAVAEQGYGLDKLINDKDSIIREAVAQQGYGLDKLIDDKEEAVREVVAQRGYGLDKLIDDESCCVCAVVVDYLNEKANDNFIIDLGNKLLDKGYKLSTNDTELIFTDETCTKFKEFHEDGLVYQVLARLLWKNIRVKEIYNPNYPTIVKMYLSQQNLFKDK